MIITNRENDPRTTTNIVITSNNKESKDMKKVIFTQEWMAMHPYEKPNEVDQYYTELANEIYHALDEACFTHQFKNVEDAKQLALSIAGYFEDVISGT